MHVEIYYLPYPSLPMQRCMLFIYCHQLHLGQHRLDGEGAAKAWGKGINASKNRVLHRS